MSEDKRTQYLRGIAASAPERQVDPRNIQHRLLHTIFYEVANTEDWRAPINVLVKIHRTGSITLGLYTDAIEYFTGTKPAIFIVEDWQEGSDFATFRIVSEGYRLGPAGA